MTAPYPDFDGTQACAVYDTDVFFPDGEQVAAYRENLPAIAVCKRCPFIRPCLAYALTHGVQGVWGGTFTSQRAKIRSANGIRADNTGLGYGSGSAVETSEVLDLHRGG